LQSPGLQRHFAQALHFARLRGKRLGEMSLPSNVRLLYAARGLRGFGDGFATIILPAYLTAIG